MICLFVCLFVVVVVVVLLLFRLNLRAIEGNQSEKSFLHYLHTVNCILIWLM